MDLYHVMNRGTEKRTIFLDTQDYARFIHNLFEFNDVHPATNTARTIARRPMFDLRGRTWETGRSAERLVDVHAWCLMKNHFHLVLSEKMDGGISKFLMKINVGYAKYFNERYERDGTLFQGKTKKVLIERDAHFMYILNYIHLNPLDYLKGARMWRTGKIENASNALRYLETYRWSSYWDYCGTRNFPSILTTNLFSDRNYKKSLARYLRTLQGQNEELKSITLE